MHRSWSSYDWRTALELSRDSVGIQEILDGADTHSLNQVAFDLPSRLIAKIYLFRTIFRGSGYAFSVDPDFMHVSDKPSYWDDVNVKFYKKYAGLDRKHHEWADEVLHGKPIVGPLGREWSIPMERDKKTGELKLPWTKFTNYPVQGTGADIMTIVRVSAFRRIKAANIPCKFITTVHDSIVVDTPTEFVQQIVDIFYQVFDDLQLNIRRLFRYDWVVPMTCECKVGPNMKNQQKIGRTA